MFRLEQIIHMQRIAEMFVKIIVTIILHLFIHPFQISTWYFNLQLLQNLLLTRAYLQ